MRISSSITLDDEKLKTLHDFVGAVAAENVVGGLLGARENRSEVPAHFESILDVARPVRHRPRRLTVFKKELERNALAL